MLWWAGVFVSEVYFTVMGMICAKYLDTLHKQLIGLLIALPVIYGFNVLYGRSIALATARHVPFFFIQTLAVSISLIVGVVLGRLMLGQHVSWLQLAGMALVVIGVLLVHSQG